MIFQASDFKEKHFLNNKLHLIIPLYIKGGPWISYFNSLTTRATCTITNHTPIREFCI